MAIINGLYVHVTNESWVRDVDSTSHPVESGLPTTDIVRAKALSISLSGKIVNYGNVTAKKAIEQIKSWQKTGNLISYRGREIAGRMQIRSFESSFSNTNAGGADFSMELVEVRIAQSAYTPKKETDKLEEAKKNMVIEVGSVVVFMGGNVYKASDSKKPAASRKASKCKVTKISKASYSVHQYHLVSIDGGMVYGWVDKARIMASTSTSTDSKTNAGTQQVESNGTAVYHKVKKGDTLWNLTRKKYKSLGKDWKWVWKNNPHAFSNPKNVKTLQVGKKLLMGYK